MPLRVCRQALAQVSGIALIEQVVHRKPESPRQEGARPRSTAGKRGSVSMYLFRAMQGLDGKALRLQMRPAFQLWSLGELLRNTEYPTALSTTPLDRIKRP